MNYIESQFGNPRGIIGHLVGMIMAYENRRRNEWALSLLNIQPTDRILEIGYGPGWAIQQASRFTTQGLVAGVDSSETLLYWVEEEEIMPSGWKNPIRRVKAPKLPTDPIEPIQIEEIHQLLKTCQSNYSGVRDKAMMLGLLDTVLAPKNS